MSKQASAFQEKTMSLIYRGKEIFKPLNTGRIDERMSCVREFVANIFFYTGAILKINKNRHSKTSRRSHRQRPGQVQSGSRHLTYRGNGSEASSKWPSP